jgi:hypothetical protein
MEILLICQPNITQMHEPFTFGGDVRPKGKEFSEVSTKHLMRQRSLFGGCLSCVTKLTISIKIKKVTHIKHSHGKLKTSFM